MLNDRTVYMRRAVTALLEARAVARVFGSQAILGPCGDGFATIPLEMVQDSESVIAVMHGDATDEDIAAVADREVTSALELIRDVLAGVSGALDGDSPLN